MLHLNHPIRLPADVRIVGNEEKGMTGFVKVVENLHDQIFVLRVEVPSGLISQNNLRLINHGTRNTDSLLLTAGKLGREKVHSFSEPDLPQDLCGFSLIRHAVKILGQHDILQRREVGDQVKLLEDKPDLFASKPRPLFLFEREEVDSINPKET